MISQSVKHHNNNNNNKPSARHDFHDTNSNKSRKECIVSIEHSSASLTTEHREANLNETMVPSKHLSSQTKSLSETSLLTSTPNNNGGTSKNNKATIDVNETSVKNLGISI
jgi:hypothetical protein